MEDFRSALKRKLKTEDDAHVAAQKTSTSEQGLRASADSARNRAYFILGCLAVILLIILILAYH